jgi:hypothetical protein
VSLESCDRPVGFPIGAYHAGSPLKLEDRAAGSCDGRH